MNNSKTKVMLEDDTQYMSTTLISRMLKAKTRTFKEESRPDGQAPRHVQRHHWNMLEETGLQRMRTSSNVKQTTGKQKIQISQT